MHVFDARPFQNAVGNKLKKGGGGFENEKNYNNCKIHFLNIDNIHCVRDSYKNINKACY